MTVYNNLKLSQQYSLPVSAGLSLNPVTESLLFNVAFVI